MNRIEDLRAKLEAAGGDTIANMRVGEDLIAAGPALLVVAAAAKECAGWDWGTSVSEEYHNNRILHMNRLRDALASLLDKVGE